MHLPLLVRAFGSFFLPVHFGLAVLCGGLLTVFAFFEKLLRLTFPLVLVTSTGEHGCGEEGGGDSDFHGR